MTATVSRQAIPVDSEQFDPLVDLDGLWTVDLAERYLPIPGVPAAKYECWDGRLFMAPAEAAQNSYGASKLMRLLAPGAEAVGLYIYGTINLLMGQPDRWVQPDVTVLRSPEVGTWVAPEHCLLPVEFISPESRRRDRIDKPRRYADMGIPWYMTVELEHERDYAAVVLYRLANESYSPTTKALAEQRFEMAEPFEASFDPADLLVR